MIMVSNTALIYNCVSHFKHIKSRLGRQEMGCAEFQNPDDFASQVINMALVVQSLSVEEAENILVELYKDMERELSIALAKLHEGAKGVRTVQSGTIYDSTVRNTQSHKGNTRISGPANNPYVGHTTQKYPDNYRVSWDNPDQTGFHWTKEDVPKSDQEARHEPPPDAHRRNDT